MDFHVKLVHEGSIKKHECDKCNKLFNSNNSLKKHIAAIHEKIKDFNCAKCLGKFVSKHSLNTHIKRFHEQAQKN